MDKKKFIDGIRLTGFPLENATVEKLVSARWSIISNKYYLDSDNPQPREIDILAYKVTNIQGVEVVTALIISCKKSERNIWAFLTRKADLKNPNIDFNPVHFRTDYVPLSFYLRQERWRDEYVKQAVDYGVAEVFSVPDYQVFALQQMLKGVGNDAKSEGKPNNDSDMFGSIQSLMKAQFHEESLTSERKGPRPRVYQFNLISLADTEFLRLEFTGPDIQAIEADHVHYVTSYLFNKRNTFSRVTFVRSDAFDKLLEDYGRLHVANTKIVDQRIHDFFHLILTDAENHPKRRALLPQFRERLKNEIWFYTLNIDENVKFEEAWLSWSDEKKLIEIHLPAAREVIDYLNNDESVRRDTAKTLFKVYRYVERFEYV